MASELLLGGTGVDEACGRGCTLTGTGFMIVLLLLFWLLLWLLLWLLVELLLVNGLEADDGADDDGLIRSSIRKGELWYFCVELAEFDDTCLVFEEEEVEPDDFDEAPLLW